MTFTPANLKQQIADRLGIRDLFDGYDVPNQRDRLKVLLLERGLTRSHAGEFEGEQLSWAEVYRRIFLEDL